MAEVSDFIQTHIALYCPHCGLYVCLMQAQTVFRDLHENVIWHSSAGDMWWIGVCPNCRNGVLVHTDVNAGTETCYPTPLPTPTDERIPDEIRRDLDEAKRCYSVAAYRACAVMARRSMQTACIEQGAAKGNLVSQLHELEASGIITKSLKEWGDAIRWVGNDAAHPNEDDLMQEDAEAILNLAEQFMHTLYIAPAIAQGIQGKLRP